MKKEIDSFRQKGIETFPVSAATGEGLETLLQAIIKILRRSN